MNKVTQIAKAEAALIKQDPVLGKMIELQKPITYLPRDDYFFSLCRSIVGQQISVKAAAAIFKRLEEVTNMDPAKIVSLTDSQIKEIGLSRQKANYLRDLAKHFVDNPKVYNHLEKLTDDEVVADLTKIKGIGVWTAQMFLMFTLGRLDVFAADDIGLKRAVQQLYGSNKTLSKSDLLDIAETWRPYRSVASWHLWKSLQNTP